MPKNKKTFSTIVPVTAMFYSAVLPLFDTLRAYVYLKIAAHGAATVSFGTGAYRFTIPTDNLLWFAWWGSTHRLAEGPIRAIHAPAMVIDGLVSIITSSINWRPESFLTPIWVLVLFPLFALPAWWLVGRGVDGLLERRRIRLVEMIFSAVLMTVFVALAGMIRLGMSATERTGRVEWYMWGFGFWGILIAVPLLAWIFQKRRAKRR